MEEFLTEKGGPAADRILASFDFLEDWIISSKYRGCAFLNTLSETLGQSFTCGD